MEFQNYDDYMRSALSFSSTGAQIGMQDSFPMSMPNNCTMGMQGCCSNMNYPNMCMTPFNNMHMASNQMWQTQSCDLEKLYPDCYRVLLPLVVSACRNISMPITEEMLDKMTDDIYDKAVTDDRINVNITVEIDNRETKSDNENRQTFNKPPRRNPRRNRFLRDLIRILLLRELIGRR